MFGQQVKKRIELLALTTLVLILATSACGTTASPTLEPTTTAEPTHTPAATKTPTPTETPEPTDTPTPTDTPEPTSTPRPTWTPRPTATPRPPSVVDAHMGGNVSIQGIVKDTSGNVAPDVLVWLAAYKERGGFDIRQIKTWDAYTDETGSYSFKNLPEVDGGHYEVRFAGRHQYGRVYENSIYRISEDKVSGDFHLTTGITDFRVITNEDETGGTLCVLNVTLYPVTGSTLHALVQYEDADGTTKSLYSSRCRPGYFIGLNRGTGPDNHVYSAAGCQYVQLRDGMGIYEGLAGGIYYMNFDYVRSDGVEVHGAIPPFEIPPGETKLLEYTIPLNP